VAPGDRQQRREALLQQRIETCRRIGEPAQLRKRNRALGKAFEGEEVQLALRGEDDRRLEPVGLKAAARADANARLTQAGSPRA
jgi:hypothetical protein